MSMALEPVGLIGVGAMGLATAQYLHNHGRRCLLFDANSATLRRLSEETQPFDGAIGTGVVDMRDSVCHDLEEIVDKCDLVVLSTPAFAHEALATRLAPLLVRRGRRRISFLLQPGGTLGAVFFRKFVQKGGVDPTVDFRVLEGQNTIFVSRIDAEPPHAVHVHAKKKLLKVAAFPTADTPDGISLLKRMIPDLEYVAQPCALSAGMDNMNAVIHPAVFLSNAARIDAKETWNFYRDGCSVSVSRIVEKVDEERCALMRAYGLQPTTCVDWMAEVYGHRTNSVHDAVSQNKAYEPIRAPTDPGHRYIVEDLPCGLVPLQSLGQAAGVPTPTIDALLYLTSLLTGSDFVRSGRTLQRIGMDSLPHEELVRLLGIPSSE